MGTWGHAGDISEPVPGREGDPEWGHDGDTGGLAARLGMWWHLSQRLAQEVMRQRGRAEAAEEALGGLARAAARYWEGTGRNWRDRGHWEGLGGGLEGH